MITKGEQHSIEQYLKSVDINTMEFFEEMYDHICTSFENRKDKTQDIKTHIRDVVQPSFGGVKGIHRIRKQRVKTRTKLMRKRFSQLYIRHLISWPTALGTVLIALISIGFFKVFGAFTLLALCLIFCFSLPTFQMLDQRAKFWKQCQKESKPYSRTEVHEVFDRSAWLMMQVPILLYHVISLLGFKEYIQELLVTTPIISISASTFVLTYTYTLRKLYKEEFTIKTSFN